MPRSASEDNSRLELRIRPDDKATIVRAALLERTDVTHFVLKTLLPAALAVIERAERLDLSERDSLLVLDLLEKPPRPQDKLLATARALPTES